MGRFGKIEHQQSRFETNLLQSLERYGQLADAWPERMFSDWHREHPHASQASQRAMRAKGVRDKAQLEAYLKQGAAALTAADRKRMKHFHKRQVFSDEHEPNAYNELRAMGMNELAALSAVEANPAGGVCLIFPKLVTS